MALSDTRRPLPKMCFQVTPWPEKSAPGRSPFGGYVPVAMVAQCACQKTREKVGRLASGAGFGLGGAAPMSLPAPGNHELGGYNQAGYWNAPPATIGRRGASRTAVSDPGPAPNPSVVDLSQKHPFLSPCR